VAPTGRSGRKDTGKHYDTDTNGIRDASGVLWPGWSAHIGSADPIALEQAHRRAAALVTRGWGAAWDQIGEGDPGADGAWMQ
jgi:hypothetical protein